MGKALKTAGVIIGAAALIATGVGALAMPGLAGSTTLFGISTGTLNTISSGLVAVGGILDKPKSQGSARPDEWTSNPDQPTPFLFGRMGVAGKIVQRDEFGPDNMYQGIVGIISGAGPIKGIQSFKGDDQAVTFGANGIAVSSQWQGEMWMVRRSGAQPDTVLTVPAGLKSGGQSFEWSSSAKLSGKACYLQVLGENSKGSAYPAGIPDPVHVGEGIYGYDPRYDSTYPGGDGPCRLGVRSTYRYIEDPIIAGLNWALGMVENGQVVGGVGASVDGIDIPAFVEAANISEANGWKVAAWPDTSEDVSSVLDQFLQAGGAVRARHAGKISCVSRGAPRASVVTVTARDMAGSIELNTAPSLFDQLNTITPRFMSEAGGWKLTPTNPVSFSAYVTDDGGKHSDQIDYRFCPLLKQAAELAAYDILDAREPFSGSVPLKPHMRLLKRGDCFVIDEPGVLLDGVKCIVLSRSYDPKTAQVRIGFRSETDSKHALALGKTTTLPDFPVLTPTDPTFVSPPEAEDWTLTSQRFLANGTAVPALVVVGIVDNATATAVLYEFRPYGVGAAWASAGEEPPTSTRKEITGLTNGTQYEVAVSYRRGENYSDQLVLGPVTAQSSDATFGPNANRVPMSGMPRGGEGWTTRFNPSNLAFSLNSGVAGGYAFYQANITATAANQIFSIGTDRNAGFTFPVTPGERLSVQSRVQFEGATSGGTFNIRFLDESNNAIGGDRLLPIPSGVVQYPAYFADFFDVPVGARRCEIEQYITSSGAGVMNVAIAAPMVTSANPGQVLHPPYSPGPIDLTGAVQWIDRTGRIVDGRGLPINAGSGSAIVLNPAAMMSPGSPPNSAVTVAATTATLVGGLVLSLPSANIAGLSSDTNYAMFRDLVAGAYIAGTTNLTGYFTDASRYLFMGYQRTAVDSGGGYSPPPPAPPGGGGGYCPDEDTPILMMGGGTKRAGDLVVGDTVLTMHETTLTWGPARVYAVEPYDDERLEVVAGDRNLIATPGHRLHVQGKGFVALADLKIGDCISGDDGRVVQSVEPAGQGRVVRISVEGAQTYVANGLLSHNLKPLPTPE